MRQILKNTFWQLIAVYTVLVVLISLNFFWKYTLHFELFALLLGILGIVLVWDTEDKPRHIKLNKKMHYVLFGLAIFLILLVRVIPYVDNSIPLGYDTGIYKYAFEEFALKGFSVDPWVKGAISPGFLYLFSFLYGLGVNSNFILIGLFILFNVLLGVSVYLFAKEYFNSTVGIIAILLFALSVIQFKVFSYLYYKNIIALSAFLLAFVFLKKEKRYLFVIFGAIVGIMHLPTLYIFGLSYILFTIFQYKEWKRNVLSGVLILAITAIFYIGFYKEAVLPLISPLAQSFVSPGESAGTFVSFFVYQFSTLAYLPFAILGFIYLIKKKQFNALFFWTILNASIVYFQFFFFNRFIIHLDIALIILASAGFYLLMQSKKIGVLITVILMLSAGFVTIQESYSATPLITSQDLELIQKINQTEQDASVIAISSEYSPWVLGYSQRKTIAPGLFNENKWNQSEWDEFWKVTDKNSTQEMLWVYRKPLYLFAGTKDFSNPCFTLYLENNQSKIYKYDC